MTTPDRCAPFTELIWLAIDGELAADERRSLDAHLASCAACREKVERSRAVAAGLRSLPVPPVPAGFKEATLERLDARPVLRVAWRAPALAAAAAVVVLATWWGMRDRSGDADQTDRTLEQVASAPKEEAAGDGGARYGQPTDAPEPQSAPAAPGAPPPAELDALEADREGLLRLKDQAEAPPAGDLERESADEDAPKDVSKDTLEWKEKRNEERKRAGDEATKSDDAVKTERQDGFEDKLRKANESGERGEPVPIDVVVREAATADAALHVLLDRVELARVESSQRSQLASDSKAKKAAKADPTSRDEEDERDEGTGAPAREGEKRDAGRDDDAGEVRRGLDGETRAAPAAKAPAAPAEVVFLDLSAGDAASRAWLKARAATVEEGGIAVVDVSPAEHAALLTALAKSKRLAQPKDAADWLERVAAVAPPRKPAGDELAKGPGTAGRGPPPKTIGGLESAGGKKDADKSVETGGAKGAELGQAKETALRVRLVLWLGPPR